MALLNLFKKAEPTPTYKAFSNIEGFTINYDTSLDFQPIQKTGNGYLYGENGMFPQQLNHLYGESPLHSSILEFKKLMAVGGGLISENNSLSGAEKIALNQLTNQFDKILKEVAMDYFLHARVCLLIRWNDAHDRILTITRVAPERVHINDVNERMEPINYIYNWDWSNAAKYQKRIYPAFDQRGQDCEQLFVLQVSSPGMKLYSEPSYRSALPWIYLDAEMAQYHKANINNSLNPSMVIQFYEKPGTEEEKQSVLYGLNRTFQGARKSGKAMVHFNDGKETAPTITQLEPNKLDKTFLSLTDTIQRQLCYAHQIDPQLLGLKTPGSLGNSGEIENTYRIFNASVVQPAQQDIETMFNTLVSINRIPTKLKLKEADLFGIKQNKGEEI